ncbi:hypothetical protein PMAYCL1PPCAC_14552, partial [Pristionchus mayeri]
AEQAAKFGISAQKHVDTCTDSILNFAKAKSELLGLIENGLSSVGRIVNETEYDLFEMTKAERKTNNTLEQIQT